MTGGPRLGRIFRHGRDDVAWDVFGYGPPVLLLHGFPGNAFSWREVAPALSETHRVHVLDLKGFGASTKRRDQPVGAAAQARMLAAFLRAEGIEDVQVVAHDAGAAVALAAYLYEGCPFRRLVLLDAAVLNPCITENTRHAMRFRTAYETMPAPLYERLLRAHLPTTMHRTMTEDVFQGYFGPWSGAEGQAAYYNFVGQLDETLLDDLRKRLPEVRCPVRIIWGEQDTWIPLSKGAELRSLISGAEFRTVPGAGHFLMEDEPAEVTRLIIESLDVSDAA